MTEKEIDVYKLVHYANDDTQDEYVVIVSPGDNPKDFRERGFAIREILDIDGDAGQFPTDRILKGE